MAALDDLVLWQKAGQAADGGRLTGPLLPADEHAADRGHDGVEDQGELHGLLAHDRREGEAVPVERDAHLLRLDGTPNARLAPTAPNATVATAWLAPTVRNGGRILA